MMDMWSRLAKIAVVFVFFIASHRVCYLLGYGAGLAFVMRLKAAHWKINNAGEQEFVWGPKPKEAE